MPGSSTQRPRVQPAGATNLALQNHRWRTAPAPARRGNSRVVEPATPSTLGLERTALLLTDFLAALTAFYLAWFARYQLHLINDVDPGSYVGFDVYLPLGLGLAAAFLAVLAMQGLYRLPRAASALDDLSTLFAASGLSLMALFAVSTFIRYPAESRLTLIFAWLFIPLLDALARAAYLWAIGRLRARGVGVARTVVVGNNQLGRMIMQALDLRPHLGFAVAGYLDDDPDPSFGRFRRLGTPRDLEQVVAERSIAQVIIALPGTSHDTTMQIVDHCRRRGVQFRLVPDLYEVSLGRLDMDIVSGIPLMGMKDASIRGVNFFLKRVIDVLGAGVLLLVLGPLIFLPLAIAVKLDDRDGSVFFGQTRVGRFGRPFTCWKFRSMRRDADALLSTLLDQNEAEGPIFKMRDDPRRTRVGRFLRRWSLDELPQIWNVFIGDMSLVGPRPPTPREVAQYEDWHFDRLETLPGMTGLWQVSGRSQLGFSEQVLLDITYIENWSLGMDLRILLRTIPAVITGKGAF